MEWEVKIGRGMMREINKTKHHAKSMEIFLLLWKLPMTSGRILNIVGCSACILLLPGTRC